MHGLIRDRLEDYLGAPGRKLPLEIEQHLRNCEECREELSWMQEQSRLLRSLAASREFDPAPGFYARVVNRAEAQQGGSVWTAFLDPVFGRRLSAVALAMVMLIVSLMVFAERSRQPERFAAADAMVVNEERPPLGIDRDRDRETVFVTLATYNE
jgi:anti-sigma factor RsiW